MPLANTKWFEGKRKMKHWREEDGITVSWRLGSVQRRFKSKTEKIKGGGKVSFTTDSVIENWDGIAAASGLSEEHFIKQIALIEEHIKNHTFDGDGRGVFKRERELELHITFSAEVHPENQKR
jgi:hypothetical protein